MFLFCQTNETQERARAKNRLGTGPDEFPFVRPVFSSVYTRLKKVERFCENSTLRFASRLEIVGETCTGCRESSRGCVSTITSSPTSTLDTVVLLVSVRGNRETGDRWQRSLVFLFSLFFHRDARRVGDCGYHPSSRPTVRSMRPE